MKRRRTADTITGGTGDFSPQLLTAEVVMTAANTFTEVQVPIPVSRFATLKGKSIVFEVLGVDFYMPAKDNNPAAGGEVSLAVCALTTTATTSINFNNPRTFSAHAREYRGAFTALGSYQSIAIEPFQDTLEDGHGNGFLVATDNIYLAGVTSAYTGAGTFVVKILYRFKAISLEEYIGIVQGQQ